MSNFNFYNMEPVGFDDGVVAGKGKIVGCASIEQPVMGRLYLVEVTDESFPTKEYPYRVITMAECHITPVLSDQEKADLYDELLETFCGRKAKE